VRSVTELLRRARAALIGEAARLPSEIAREHPELARVHYRRGGLPPRIGGWCLGCACVPAITLWRTVWLAPATEWHPEVLFHELRHVQQFSASAVFPLRYVWQSFRHGYRANAYEVDARTFAAERVRPGRSPAPARTGPA
jgi:hypothetical protein